MVSMEMLARGGNGNPAVYKSNSHRGEGEMPSFLLSSVLAFLGQELMV